MVMAVDGEGDDNYDHGYRGMARFGDVLDASREQFGCYCEIASDIVAGFAEHHQPFGTPKCDRHAFPGPCDR